MNERPKECPLVCLLNHPRHDALWNVNVPSTINVLLHLAATPLYIVASPQVFQIRFNLL